MANIEQANLAGFHGVYFDDKKRDFTALRAEVDKIMQSKEQ